MCCKNCESSATKKWGKIGEINENTYYMPMLLAR